MDVRTWNVLSACAGVGGLDLGVKLAVRSTRTICYVEREAFAVATLVARMQDGCLDEAPVWSDIKTFDGKPWSGKVDAVIGGYPCQPFSIAGSMEGENDPRHLWPDIRRVVREVKPDWCFFENVENHVNIGFENVRSELLEDGFDVEAGVFTASEVGAPHSRSRLFILAGRRDVVYSNVSGFRKESNNAEPTEQFDSATIRIFPPKRGDRISWNIIKSKQIGIEPAIYRVVNGMDYKMDSSIYAYRQERLRAVGNGVVPLTAAFAFQTLMRKFI